MTVPILKDMLDQEICVGDRVVYTSNDYIQVGTVKGFKYNIEGRHSNWHEVVVRGDGNKRDGYFCHYRTRMFVVSKSAIEILKTEPT